MAELVLLTGCGDLGARVARLLLARGDTVWAMRRTPPADDDSGISWLRGDFSQPASLSALPTGITQLIHLPTPDSRQEDAYRAVFIDGLRHVLEALDSRTLKRVVFVSSTAVYGEHGDAWVDETTPTAPPGFNGAVLIQAEQWLAAQPVPSVTVRLAGLYGPGRLQLTRRLQAGQARAPIDPPHWSNRMHIDDAAAAVAHLTHLPDAQPLYIGCDNTPLPQHTLYSHLAALLNAPAPPEGPPPAGVGSKRLSNARLRASGFSPRWPDAREGYAALLAQQPPGV